MIYKDYNKEMFEEYFSEPRVYNERLGYEEYCVGVLVNENLLFVWSEEISEFIEGEIDLDDIINNFAEYHKRYKHSEHYIFREHYKNFPEYLNKSTVYRYFNKWYINKKLSKIVKE